MKKILILLFLILTLTGCKKTNENNNKGLENVNQTLLITIDDKEYKLELENNKTVEELVKLLPLDITMKELNDNEKYYYLDTSLPTNSSNPKHINKGDVYLYGDNCLVIFYKSFNTSYSYTKIGHINDLDNIGSDSIKVTIKG